MKATIKIEKEFLLDHKAFINGQWVDAQSKKNIPVINPASREEIGSVPDLSREEVAVAIAYAKTIAPVWAAKTNLQRADMLLSWYQLILLHQDDLATILSSENGKPLHEARSEIKSSAAFIRWFAEETRRTYGRLIPQQKEGTRVLVIHQPIGVTAAITPWNFPSAMIARKIAPALAAGCPMIIKPSEFTPFSAIALVKLAEQAGFSKSNGFPGLIQIVTSRDAAGIGLEFCENPLVKKISVTGSTRVGKIIMAQSAQHIKKLSLELGGNAPFIVFDDADLDAAVAGAIICKFRNGGQTCVCANRIFAQKDIYERFVDKLSAEVSQFKVGDGFQKDVDIGPLINQASFDKVQSHVQDAVATGGTVTTGGKPHSLGGTFFQPTVIRDVSSDALINTEETFGPVGGIIPFSHEEEVIEKANATEFGLSAYFFSQNLGRIWRVAEQIESGMVGVNEGLISAENVPFGGVKQSGLGHEGGLEGIQEYLQTKYILMGGLGTP